MNGMNGLLRMMGVPVCAGISSACFFLMPLIGSNYPYDGGRLGALVFFCDFWWCNGPYCGLSTSIVCRLEVAAISL